jgi:hypothetical protein
MAIRKAKTINFDPQDLLDDAIKRLKKEEIDKDGKVLDVVSFANQLLGAYPYPAQEIVLKFLYAGTRFNEGLTITEEDIAIIESWEIPNDWLLHGDKSKIKILEENRKKFEKDPMNSFFREVVLVFGRRAGKSFLSSLIAVYEAYKLIMLKDPHAFYGDEKRKLGGELWIINTAISEKQAKSIVFSQIKSFIYDCPAFFDRIGHVTEDMIYLLTDVDKKRNERIKNSGGKPLHGSIVIACGNSNSPALRGHSTIACIYDEMAHYVDSSGKASAEEVYTAIEPSTSTFYAAGDGRNIIISTPDLPSGFFFSHFRSAKTVDTSLVFQIPTWDANPNYTKESLKDKFQNNPDRAAAEYGAKFRRSAGNIYFPHQLVEDAMVRRDGWYKRAEGTLGKDYYMHIDPAKTSDRWAFMICHMEKRYDQENKIFLDIAVEDYSKTFEAPPGGVLDPDDIMDNFVIPLFKKFKIVSVSADQMFSLEQQKKLRRNRINYRDLSFGGAMKNKIYETTKDFFITGRIELCNDDSDLEGELKNIKVKHGKRNPVIENTPDDSDFPFDDLVDCLGGCVFSMCQGAQGLTTLPKVRVVNTGMR